MDQLLNSFQLLQVSGGSPYQGAWLEIDADF
jgi:hypothetical protein